MRKTVSALLIGSIFGMGIAISGMGNPAKVLNFFDLAGSFDPSLVFVMASALAVTAIGYRIVFSRRSAPVCATSFDLPTKRRLDIPLIAGSAVFGVGWGMTGFCPGGSIPMLGLGNVETPIFVLSMIAGIVVARTLRQRATRLATA
ncbi:MAG: YeeE/YedE family protein [Rhizobiaceae bacterium]|nr:YeeE/YedE family protein [Rhizobiaceae bacterium]